LPSFAQAKGFSGHSSFSSSHITTSTSTYHSGYKSPSSSVTRTPSYSHSSSNHYTQTSRSGGFWSHAAAFGAGAFLGHMFHPFGGHYYGGSYGFSFLGLLVDILIIAIIFKVIKSIFIRRY
jgi:uncharacterized membrane protein